MFGLINRIDFGRAVEDTNLFHIRKEISDDLRLLIQWCQIVGPCNIDACTAVVIQFNIQCSGKACDRSAYNRDRGCGIGRPEGQL